MFLFFDFFFRSFNFDAQAPQTFAAQHDAQRQRLRRR